MAYVLWVCWNVRQYHDVYKFNSGTVLFMVGDYKDFGDYHKIRIGGDFDNAHFIHEASVYFLKDLTYEKLESIYNNYKDIKQDNPDVFAAGAIYFCFAEGKLYSVSIYKDTHGQNRIPTPVIVVEGKELFWPISYKTASKLYNQTPQRSSWFHWSI
jgi:hypothetical protein